MHELAVCQNLMKTVAVQAASHQASAVTLVRLSIGPLSGVEPELLMNAWSIARAGTIADAAVLEITETPIEIRCRACGHEGTAEINRLVCGACGNWQVELVSGDEMLLVSLELETDAEENEEEISEPTPRRGAI